MTGVERDPGYGRVGAAEAFAKRWEDEVPPEDHQAIRGGLPWRTINQTGGRG